MHTQTILTAKTAAHRRQRENTARRVLLNFDEPRESGQQNESLFTLFIQRH